MVCYLSSCLDFGLHSGGETSTMQYNTTYSFTNIRIAVFLYGISVISSWCVQFNLSPTWFSWTYLMAYSKAKLKNNTNKAYPCFTACFVWTHLNQHKWFHGYCKLYEVTVHYLSHNWIIGFLEVWIAYRLYHFSPNFFPSSDYVIITNNFVYIGN
jgi:hypothetical protein